MKSVTIRMPYLGKILSVNHYKFGYFTRPEVKAWMEELGWLIKGHHIEEWKIPLKVTCDGVFKDKRSQPDLSNLSKVILDAIEETTGINDRDMRWCDGGVAYCDDSPDYKEPILLVTIEELGDVASDNIC